MKANSILDNVRIGLAGSYARGENTESNIEIVISYEAGPDDLETYIMDYMKSRFLEKRIDLIHLESINKFIEELDKSESISFIGEFNYNLIEELIDEIIWIE